ncbi:MAG: TonB-dependent receptor [bacterium]|nr:TonB-dependent receptor [bacterium]
MTSLKRIELVQGVALNAIRCFIFSIWMLLGYTIAHSAEIRGVVTDANNGEPMIGVSVLVEELKTGAVTDLDGNYTIKNLPEGTYTLKFSTVGYAPSIIRNVDAKGNRPIQINVRLSESSVEFKEMVVEAKAVDNTQIAIINIQRNAASVSDGISAEQIKKSPDNDAGDALKRVTGVTLVGDKYVFVRGMGERYNNTRLNGISIASPEPLKRIVPFDIIPAGFLQNVIVHKTFTPDLPGDFAGGSVQLKTQEFPEKLTLSGSISMGYNNKTTLRDFWSYQGGHRDFLATDDGTRALPRFVRENTGAAYNWMANPPLQKELAKSFSNIWTPRIESAPFNASRSFSFGNQSWIGTIPIGYLLSVSQSQSYSNKKENLQMYTVAGNNIQKFADYQVSRSTASYGLGGVLDLNIKPSQNYKMGFKSFFSRSADDETRLYQGLGKEDIHYRGYRLQWTERTLQSNQILGTLETPAWLNIRTDYSVSVSKAIYSQPDRRDILYRIYEPDTVWYLLTTSESPFRRFARMDDDVKEGTVNFSIPLEWIGKTSKIKTGVAYRTMKRKFETRKFYINPVRDPGDPYLDFSLPTEQILLPKNIDDQFELREVTTSLDPYDAKMNVTAGYLMGDLLFGPFWRVVGGVRLEKTVQTFQTYAVTSVTSGTESGGPIHTDILPSLSITYKLNTDMNLRLSGSRTIANPDYAEIVPTEDSDYYEGETKSGNPKIKHTKITNADLRWEWYPRIGENFALGVYYKYIQDPIEMVKQASGATERAKPENLVDARNIGFELEFRKSLDQLSPWVGNWIKPLSFSGNYSYTLSQIEFDGLPYDANNASNTTILTSKKRPMTGQSPYAINGTLAYEPIEWGTSIRLLYHVFGRRIVQVGAYGMADAYEEPFHKLDFYVDQKLGKNWTVKLSGTNLLDRPVRYTLNGITYHHYRTGRSISAGISYSL